MVRNSGGKLVNNRFTHASFIVIDRRRIKNLLLDFRLVILNHSGNITNDSQDIAGQGLSTLSNISRISVLISYQIVASNQRSVG